MKKNNNNDKIFVVYNETKKLAFVSFTSVPIEARMQHIMQPSNHHRLRSLIIKSGGIDKWTIKILDEITTSSTKERMLRCQFFADKFKEDGYNIINLRVTTTDPNHDNKRRKQWRINNRKRELAQRLAHQKTITCYCECGSTYIRRRRWEHNKTKKHKNWLNNPLSIIDVDLFEVN